MAKKKSHKKQSFKYAEPVKASDTVAPRTAPTKSVVKDTTAPVTSAALSAEYPFLRGDMIRLAAIAGSLIALELGLWYAFGHTGLGDTVYNLYQL